MTMDEHPAAIGPGFTVGGVISTGLSVVFANIFRFLVIILAVALPVAVLIGVGAAVLAASVAGGLEGSLQFEDNGGAVVFLVFAAFLGLLAYFLIQSALTYGALQQLRGRRPSIGACLSNGLAALPRVFLASLVLFVAIGAVGFMAASIFQALAIGGGFAGGLVVGLLLLAGFLYVVTLIWVFVPAIVVERAGPLACFGRSVALTKGRRWGIFGILMLIGLANWAISIASQFLTRIAPVAGSAIDIASGLFFMALGSVMAAVGYYYLRAEKEGVAIDDVVTVFD